MKRDVDAVLELQQALRSGVDQPLPRTVLRLRSREEDEERDIKEALRQLVLHTTVLNPFDDHTEFRFGDIGDLYSHSRDAGCPDHLVEVLNYLRLYQSLAGLIAPLIADTNEVWFGNRSLPNAIDDLAGAIESLNNFDCALMSSMLVLGKVLGLRNRTEASEMFVGSQPGLDAHIDVFMGELGARTYFERPVLEHREPLITERRASLAGSWHQSGQICPADARFLVLMSCDQRFFEIYFPYWLSVAEYLRPLGFAFHFLVIEPPEHASLLIDSAENLRSSLARFRGYEASRFCRNISLSSVAAPAWCPKPRTFAACARFLYARMVAEQTEMPVVVQDVDFYLATDPRPWFSALPTDKIALTSSRVAKSIDPWQKFRGGAYVFPAMDRAFSAAAWLEDYLLYGLGEEHSWFLDQNALAFLYEIVAGQDLASNMLFSLDDLRPLLRPISDSPAHSLWEECHDEAAREPGKTRRDEV